MAACPFSDTEVSVPGQAGRERASAGRYLNGAAADLLADEAFDVRFERCVAVGQTQIQLEVAIVNRANFDGYRQTVFVQMRFAVAGHAEQQSGRSPVKALRVL